MSNEQIRILAWVSRPEHQKRWAALETIPGVDYALRLVDKGGARYIAACRKDGSIRVTELPMD